MKKEKKYKENVDYTTILDEDNIEQYVLTKFSIEDFEKLINNIKSIGMNPVFLFWEKGYYKVEMEKELKKAYYAYTHYKVFNNLYNPKETVEIIGEMI